MPQQAQLYERPPITEAVIEVRFTDLLGASEINEANKALKVFYSYEEITRDVNFAIIFSQQPFGNATTQQDEQVGFKRSSPPDLTQIVLIKPVAFSVAQLAPYPGWDEFFQRFKRDWSIWKKVIGYKKIARVGIRYINRIDIPIQGNSVVNYEDFLNVSPRVPEELGSALAYGVQAQFPIDDLGCILTINSSSIPSPLLDHLSFLFDQDIVTNVIVPQNDEGIFALIEKIRLKKNEVFELCVTDKSRSLFQQ